VSAPCPVFGFNVVFQLAPELSEAAMRALWDDFMREVVEGRGLVCEGDGAAGRWAHVVHGEAAQATDADRDVVVAWAAARPEIVRSAVGPLVDVASEAL
jgi:uncharacterized protein YggL (DUF469 family)